jgi:outer membrane protein assembly factor BamB
MYVTDMAANVYALNAATGRMLWQFTLPPLMNASA